MQYEGLKGRKHEWDVSDLTGHVYRQLGGEGDALPARRRFHYIYVDEARPGCWNKSTALEARGELCARASVNDTMALCEDKQLMPVQASRISVYLTQVQDLTPSQLALFKFLCLDPRTGLILAGDTAQTIARGTNFRFEVIR